MKEDSGGKGSKKKGGKGKGGKGKGKEEKKDEKEDEDGGGAEESCVLDEIWPKKEALGLTKWCVCVGSLSYWFVLVGSMLTHAGM